MKIYTRTGDKGKTGIHGGQRVDKDDIRIEVNGCLDELNSMLGVIRAFLPNDHEWQELLFKIQTDMMIVMSHVATPSDIRDKNPNLISEDLVTFCEDKIDEMTVQVGESKYFILPGGNIISSHLQLARTICRRAERRLCTLNKSDEVTPVILQFINRLSDLLFIMARREMFRDGTEEELWKNFQYKRKNTK